MSQSIPTESVQAGPFIPLNGSFAFGISLARGVDPRHGPRPRAPDLHSTDPCPCVCIDGSKLLRDKVHYW